MKRIQLIAFFLFFSLATWTQSFEGSTIPNSIRVADAKSTLQLSDKYYKDGGKSLLWIWNQPNAIINVNDPIIAESVNHFDKRAGITFWICSETPLEKPLEFNFKDSNGTTHYTFKFYLNFTGWRAGWIAYSDMWTASGGKTSKKDIERLEITSPEGIKKGKIWIDRLEITNHVDRQATPDAQIPDNNRHLDREIWHWGLLHKWEQNQYDILLPKKLTLKQKNEIKNIYSEVKNELKGKTLSPKEEEKLATLAKKLNISDDGTKGAPLMQKNNLKEGDVNYAQLSDLLDLSARGWYIDRNDNNKALFIKAVRYMLHQGFAYESGMGTNHHYGYDIRPMFGAIWWMEDVLKKDDLWDKAREALTYWSGLQETRQPFNEKRDEITDTWNTLILPRLACAMMQETPQEQHRAMAGLARWINGSIRYSPGTIGGIKIDGTAFHHGGHYPAYSMPGYASIGEYLRLVQDTSFGLNVEARQILKFALLSLSKQTNLRDWGIGASGRHPFEGNINKKCVLTYAYAAQAFDPIDKELAGEFLRLSEGLKQYSLERKLIRFFEKNEIKKNDYPKGFHVYNYASQGIYRYGKNMVSLKGFTTNIWGSEIYTADNRYGRYQSYGSVQIIGSMNTHPVNDAYFITEQASRYKQEGWDWNRNPGVTSIHLPFDSLDSPFKHSLMLRQTERFSGASNFENGEYGMFAMKLGEKQYSNFTPSFKAHKSVFCFDGKIICLGSNISNRNSEYPTETILFQQALFSQNESIKINNETITAYPYSRKISDSENTPTILKDLTGQHYYIPEGQNINIVKQSQQSRHNKTKEITNGDFASAYFEHGESPENAQYEYMILLDATSEKISNLYKKETGYEVILKNQNAHIVQDKDSRVRAYAVFNDFTSNNDPFILKSTEETMIMLRREKNKLKISVCDPDLNLGEYRYTTSNSSGMKRKYILLKGKYRLIEENEAVRIRHEENNTSVEIKCQHGIPVEFQLIETP